MSSNTPTIADPADGDYEDWFEIYNAGTTAFDLTGYYLTCDLADPDQWLVPSGVIIPPGGFLLVWADGETGQNGTGKDLHSSFSLRREGEAIGVFTPTGTQVDGITFGYQADDESHGRFPDGQTQQATRLYETTPKRLNVAP